METDYAWIIKRNDGKYCCNGWSFLDKLVLADIFECENQAFANISDYELENCEPVKVKIEVVKETKNIKTELPKIKIKPEQVNLLNEVLNYALNFIDQTTQNTTIMKMHQDGKYYELKYEDFEEDVTELASWLEKYFEIEKSDGGGNLLNKIIKEDSKN